MNSAWVDADARATVDRLARTGTGRELALRIYTARLLGTERKLVLHGGGNASVKCSAFDMFGEPVPALHVKASGSDMASAEPASFPALELESLRKLRGRNSLADEDMIRVLQSARIDPVAPSPSVESLLHAFLPYKFVDHTHAGTVLSLADQTDGEATCAEVYAGRAGVVPYVRPGLGLARTALDIYEAKPDVEGLILLKHGIVTFGDDAREAYERMIELVDLAEEHIRRNRKSVFVPAPLPQVIASAADVAPILRGACSTPDERIEGAWRRPILEFRTSTAIRNFVDGAELGRYGKAGVVTPDHAIHTKNWPLLVGAPQAASLDRFARAAREAASGFVRDYEAYFARNHGRYGNGSRMRDRSPRVVLVSGLGLFGLGQRKTDAVRAADLAESAIEVISDAEAIGRYQPISEAEAFEMEYWPLEVAKLGTEKELPLSGQIAAITGAAGAIGAATARVFAAAGAEVALLDIDADTVREAARSIGATTLAVHCDVTDAGSVRSAFEKVVTSFGGLDILVSNAGAAWQGRIGEVGEDVLRRSFELNFFAHQRVAQAAVRIMKAQGTGGCLLFNVSKQAVNPGPNFGPYGLPKAATLFLVRQYALDHGADGIRANAVNADRVRSGLLTEDFIAERAKARGQSERDYMQGNLLGREVTAEDVAQAFLHQALELKTTGDVTTVDGGNIAAALR